MRRYILLSFAVAIMAGFVTFAAPAPGHADEQSAPYVTDIPHGFRDWRWISSAHEEGNLNSLGAVLGNDVAITDDVVDFFLPLLSNGTVTRDNVGPHTDLLTTFPYLSSPHRIRSAERVAA